uniref:Uncharacterized protein n=1 Tax=Romanomermis culicivorax TaxID=13658 RepID=A0A915JHU6_ROMCU
MKIQYNETWQLSRQDGIFDYWEFNGDGHFRQKNYPVCKQAYFHNFGKMPPWCGKNKLNSLRSKVPSAEKPQKYACLDTG